MIGSLYRAFIYEDQPRWIKRALSGNRQMRSSALHRRLPSLVGPAAVTGRVCMEVGRVFPSPWHKGSVAPADFAARRWSCRLVVPCYFAYHKHRHSRDWEYLLWSTLLIWRNAKLNLPPIRFLTSPWRLWQSKPSVLQPFYLSLGRGAKQSHCVACSLIFLQQFRLPIAWELSPCYLARRGSR